MNQNSKNIAQASGNDSLAEEDKEGEPQASGNVPMTFYTDYKNVIDKFRDYEFIYYLIHGNTSTNYNQKKNVISSTYLNRMMFRICYHH